MKKKCPGCKLVNYPSAVDCARCGSALPRPSDGEGDKGAGSKLLRRAMVCAFIAVAAVAGFYISMVFSAKGMSYEQKKAIAASIEILEAKGFTDEAFLLRRLAVFRSEDNWLNASVAKENAFAATNFPFGIVTVYPDFFTYPADDVERAAILLHEAKHMQGADEKEAYEFVWRNRKRIGWTAEAYDTSVVWSEVRKQTRDYAPGLFVCDVNKFGDCTE
jgi:hypothetical protein